MKALLLIGLLTLGVAVNAQSISPVARVALYASGAIHVNGKAATLEELAAEVARVKKARGEIWYYREKPTEEPPPVMSKVLDIIGEAQVPVSFSAKPDFSDYVDLKTGESKPRK